MMSIALDRVESVSGFGRAMARPSLFESPAEAEGKSEEEDCRSLSTASSSSSIGRNSDDENDESDRSDGGDCEEENEVQSCYKGSALDMMDSLEQVLPMRRGISSFYNGKSKSFTSLADVVTSPSIKDIAKPENAYTRRRRNILAINHLYDKSRTKRSQSTLALAVAMSSSESLSSTSEDSTSTPSPRCCLPPLYPRSSPPPRANWRSFSVADMQQCSNTASKNLN